MLSDAHNTNFAENWQFFLNENNPANFERTWNTANYLYGRIGRVAHPVTFDKVMDFSIIKKLKDEPAYAASKVEYAANFTPKTVQAIKAESGEILTKVVTVHFFPNSWDLSKKILVTENGKDIERLYDPRRRFHSRRDRQALRPVWWARIIIEGQALDRP